MIALKVLITPLQRMATTIPSSCRVPHFVGNKEIKFEEKAVPEPGPAQLLLRVRANALCGSERPQFFEGAIIRIRKKSIGPSRLIMPAFRTNGKRPSGRKRSGIKVHGSTRISHYLRCYQGHLQDVTSLLSANFQNSGRIGHPLPDKKLLGTASRDAKSTIFSSHFLVTSSQKNAFFRSLWFVKIRQASPSKK
jgi:hypothetical protein